MQQASRRPGVQRRLSAVLDDSIEAGVAASSLPLASHARRERWLLSLEAKKEGGGQAPRTQTIGDDDETSGVGWGCA